MTEINKHVGSCLCLSHTAPFIRKREFFSKAAPNGPWLRHKNDTCKSAEKSHDIVAALYKSRLTSVNNRQLLRCCGQAGCLGVFLEAFDARAFDGVFQDYSSSRLLWRLLYNVYSDDVPCVGAKDATRKETTRDGPT